MSDKYPHLNKPEFYEMLRAARSQLDELERAVHGGGESQLDWACQIISPKLIENPGMSLEECIYHLASSIVGEKKATEVFYK